MLMLIFSIVFFFIVHELRSTNAFFIIISHRWFLLKFECIHSLLCPNHSRNNRATFKNVCI
ncbi:hypothetical protein GLYMA_04G116851v4 [Glycine max]|nr:hypothetical protein GLYMA_04G116851v4 [Glycine max]KAH1110946.1 hypothetical protein GYH30_009651 [Glycine max]